MKSKVKLPPTIIALIQQLTPQEKEALVEQLNVSTHPCRQGHNYKFVGTVECWFVPPKSKFVCTRCGCKLLT